MGMNTAIAQIRPGFRQAAQQRSGKAKELASAWKPPGVDCLPQPDLDLIEFRDESLAAREPV
jgi:hypothetical protein